MSAMPVDTRPFAPGLIQGALRGGIAGVFLAIVALATIAAMGEHAGYEIAIGLPILAAVLGAGDGTSARLAAWPAASVRAVAGFAAPFAALVPVLCLEAVAGGQLPWQKLPRHFDDTVVVLAAVGIALGLGFVAAGRHPPGASIAWRAVRAMATGAVAGFLSGIAFGSLATWGVLAVAGSLVLMVGHLIARPLGRRLGEWLEPRDDPVAETPEEKPA